MSLAPSQSILRVKEGNIYGWSGVKSLTSGALTLLNYGNPSYYYLTRIQLGLDWSSIGVGETLSYTIQVDGQNLFTDKYVITDMNIGFQPQQLESLYLQIHKLRYRQHNQVIMALSDVY